MNEKFNKFTATTQYDEYTGTSACDMSKQGGLKKLLVDKKLMKENEKIANFSIFNKAQGFGLICYVSEDLNYEEFSKKVEEKNIELRKFETEISNEELNSCINIVVELAWKGILTNKTKPA